MSIAPRHSDPKRSLRQQHQYLQQLHQKKRTPNRPQDMSRILTSSIQKAKQKLQNLDNSLQQKAVQLTDHSEQAYASVNTVESRDLKNVSQVTEVRRVETANTGSNSTAIANAMRCLQTRIAELEERLHNQAKEKERLVAEVRRAMQCQEIAERSLEGQKLMNQEITEEKVRLEREVEMLKKAVEERERRIDKIRKELGKENQMNKSQAAQILRQAEALKTQNAEKDRKLEAYTKQLQNSQSRLRSKQREIDQRVSQLVQIQKQLSKRQKDLTKQQQQKSLNQSQAQLSNLTQLNHLQQSISCFQQKITDLQSINDMNKILIAKLQSQLEVQRQKNSEWMSREVQQAYIEKINMLEEELARRSHQPNKAQQKLTVIKQQHEKLRDMYDNLLLRYQRAENAKQAEEKQAKNYRKKFWEVKEILKEFTDKLQKLPGGITTHMKYLVIKASKVQYEKSVSKHQRTISGSGEKLSKSSRGRSTSRDKSLKKRKVLKMQDLNSSRNSARSISLTRSHQKPTNKSDIKSTHSKRSRKSTSKKQPQQQSLTNLKLRESLKANQPLFMYLPDYLSTDREIVLSTQINDLQKKMLLLKKQLKKLIDSKQPENQQLAEERRCRKNEIIAEIQVKSEELFVLKKKAREAERAPVD